MALHRGDVPDAALIDAARALAHGDPIEALASVGAREDARGLALRGVALAQLGENRRARQLLERAAELFRIARRPTDHARALAALGELAAAERDLAPALGGLGRAIRALDRNHDRANAAWARLVWARLATLDGRVAQAEAAIVAAARDAPLDGGPLRVAIELAQAEAAIRGMRAREAERALARARALHTANPVLATEVARLTSALASSVARLFRGDRPITMAELETILRGPLVIDGVRRRLLGVAPSVELARRPVLFALLSELGRTWPAPASARRLIEAAFAVQKPNQSHAARLRVELGRLRRAIAKHAGVVARDGGWALLPSAAADLELVLPLGDPRLGGLRALLSDGAAWSVQNLARVLSSSRRTVQRALVELESAGEVHPVGAGRSQRWARRGAPDRIASQMLLLGITDPG